MYNKQTEEGNIKTSNRFESNTQILILTVMLINFFAVPYFCDDVYTGHHLFYWEFLKNQSINQSISQSIDRFYIYPQNVYWAKNNRNKISQKSGGAVPSALPLNLPLFPLKICGKKKMQNIKKANWLLINPHN